MTEPQATVPSDAEPSNTAVEDAEAPQTSTEAPSASEEAQATNEKSTSSNTESQFDINAPNWFYLDNNEMQQGPYAFRKSSHFHTAASRAKW